MGSSMVSICSQRVELMMDMAASVVDLMIRLTSDQINPRRVLLSAQERSAC